MSLIKFLSVCVLTTASLVLWSQNGVNIKGEPKLAFSGKFDKKWSYNFQLGGLQFFKRLPLSEEVSDLERADIRGFLSYGFFNTGKLSLGYMYRRTRPFEERPGYEHRISLQYSFQHYYQAWRFGHRLIFEQRLRSSINESRLRYRFSADVPLQGQQLDVGEFYYLGSNEIVAAINARLGSLENRFSSALGWQLTGSVKLELGSEYRFRGSAEIDALHLQSSLYWRF